MLKDLIRQYEYLATPNEKILLARHFMRAGDLFSDNPDANHGYAFYKAALLGLQISLANEDMDAHILSGAFRHVGEKWQGTKLNNWAVKYLEEADYLRQQLSHLKIPHLLIITGPSCAGKSTLLRHIKAKHPDFGYAISATTRTPRPGETAEDYTFLTQRTFDHMAANGFFLEWNAKYGTPFSELYRNKDRDCIVLDTDLFGSKILKTRYPSSSTVVFLQPTSYTTIKARLFSRGTPPDELQRRALSGYKMVKEGWADDTCDFFILADEKSAADQMEKILETLPLRRSSSIESAVHRYITEYDAEHNNG